MPRAPASGHPYYPVRLLLASNLLFFSLALCTALWNCNAPEPIEGGVSVTFVVFAFITQPWANPRRSLTHCKILSGISNHRIHIRVIRIVIQSVITAQLPGSAQTVQPRRPEYAFRTNSAAFFLRLHGLRLRLMVGVVAMQRARLIV